MYKIIYRTVYYFEVGVGVAVLSIHQQTDDGQFEDDGLSGTGWCRHDEWVIC